MLRTTTASRAVRQAVGCRNIHTTNVCRAEVAAADRVPTPKEIARDRANKWLKDEGAQYRTAITTKFVGKGDRPFPMNPFFRPQAPLSNATRSEVFKLYLEDAQQWTPRALAEHFGLSIVRVQAILRLKALEQKWEAEGKPIQTNLTNGMELMLNAQTLQTLPNTRPREKLRLTSAKRLQPFFRMINEEEAFTPEDAAALMKLEPFANLQRKLDEAADHVFELEPRAAAAPKTISVDPSLKSRFQFMLVDTGNPEKTRIMVRERNGRLRGATVEERFRRKNLKPRYFM